MGNQSRLLRQLQRWPLGSAVTSSPCLFCCCQPGSARSCAVAAVGMLSTSASRAAVIPLARAPSRSIGMCLCPYWTSLIDGEILSPFRRCVESCNDAVLCPVTHPVCTCTFQVVARDATCLARSVLVTHMLLRMPCRYPRAQTVCLPQINQYIQAPPVFGSNTCACTVESCRSAAEQVAWAVVGHGGVVFSSGINLV